MCQFTNEKRKKTVIKKNQISIPLITTMICNFQFINYGTHCCCWCWCFGRKMCYIHFWITWSVCVIVLPCAFFHQIVYDIGTDMPHWSVNQTVVSFFLFLHLNGFQLVLDNWFHCFVLTDDFNILFKSNWHRTNNYALHISKNLLYVRDDDNGWWLTINVYLWQLLSIACFLEASSVWVFVYLFVHSFTLLKHVYNMILRGDDRFAQRMLTKNKSPSRILFY